MKKLLLLFLGGLAWGQTPVAHIWINVPAGTCTRTATQSAYDSTKACGSMQSAQNLASAGDTIRIKNGTYASQTLGSSAKASAVNYFAETSGSVLVAGLTINIDKVHVTGVIATGSGMSRGSLSMQANTVWTDVLVDGFKGLSAFIAAAGVTIQNSEFGDSQTSICATSNGRNTEDAFRFWTGTYGDPSNDKLLNSIIHDWITDGPGNCSSFGAFDVHADCVQVFNAGSNITIDGNKFYGCATNDIQSGGGSQSNWTVQNNYMGPSTTGSNTFTAGQASPCTGIVYRNNVLNTPGFNFAINQASPCSGGTVELSSNILLGMTSNCMGGGGSATQTGGFNIITGGGGSCGSNLKRCNPTWLNGTPSAANGYDIRLSPADTCAIGAANPGSFAPTDAFGTPRPQGSAADVGAYEFPAGVPPTITTASPMPGGIRGAPYSQTLTATGDTPIVWTGSPFFGLTLSAGGLLSGTPNGAGAASFTATATNGVGNNSKLLAITVTSTTITSTSPLPSGQVGLLYGDYIFTASGGTPPYLWSGTPPAGLALAPNGTLNGTPTTAGTSTFPVSVQDNNLQPKVGSFTIIINPSAFTPTSWNRGGSGRSGVMR